MALFNKVMVANRGAVAARVLRTLNAMGIPSLAVYSDADRHAPYLQLATETAHLGAAPARESYLNQERLLALARSHQVDALHPGYGFLSENAEFAGRVEDAGLRFIGPSPRWIAAMGHKTRARELAAQHGWPIGRGSDVLPADAQFILKAAEAIGYPVLVKPAAGGGGIGMLAARSPDQLVQAVERARSMAERGFGSGEVYLERLIERPRHVEVQVLGDRHGNVVHLYERDCSVQRRHQKIIEEAHAPGLARVELAPLFERMAATLASLGYDNLGTIELLRAPDGEFRFLEMNTRLQVEHGVTEEITGIDLVMAQVRSAAGLPMREILPGRLRTGGHAIQARVYAEDPVRFLPSPGTLTVFEPPQAEHLRVESGYRAGMDVTPHYDPLLAKVIAWAPTRPEAIERLTAALGEFAIAGVRNNIPALRSILSSPEFIAGDVHTGLAAEVVSRKSEVAVAKG